MPKLIDPSLTAAFCAAFLDMPVPCVMIACQDCMWLSRCRACAWSGLLGILPLNDQARLLKALVEQRKVTCRLMAVLRSGGEGSSSDVFVLELGELWIVAPTGGG